MNSLTSEIQALMKSQADFSQKLKQRLILESNTMKNPFKFIARLVNEGVLRDESNEPEPYFGLKEMVVQLAIMAACSKGADAIGGLMEAIEASGNPQVISALGTWVREDFETEANNGVISFPDLGAKAQSQPLRSNFFEQPAPSDELSKVATFHCQPLSSVKGKGAFYLEFDKHKMIAHLDDSTVVLWNWASNEEKTVNLRDKVELKPSEDITSFQCDEEILVVGTSTGTVYLLDTKTLQEKWSVRLRQPIDSLKFVESSIVIRTRGILDEEHFWFVEISRSKMQLLNQKLLYRQDTAAGSRFLIDPLYTFLYCSRYVKLYETESGVYASVGPQLDEVSFIAPTVINTLHLVDLIALERVVVAGCKNGVIAMWHTSNLRSRQQPFKTFQGHTKAIVSLCAIHGHLISLDQSGKLLMWSGYDLQNDNLKQPVPRVLAQNFYNVSCLVGCERWLASSSSKDGVINVWTFPDSWLRTG